MQSATTDSGAVRVNGATYYVWGVDAQVGSFLTSYIPTTAVAATRPTESANITPLGSWYNANAGTLKIEWDTFKPSTATGVSGGFSAGAFANTAYLSNATWNFIIATVAGNAIGSGLNQNNTTNKQVASYGAVAGVQVTNNGGAVATNATYTNANAPYPWTNLTFGSSPWSPVSNQINGHIRRGTYWNSALPALQMQQQSTL
jgi:hypothetical protein